MRMLVKRRSGIYQNPGRPNTWPKNNGGSQQNPNGNESTTTPEGSKKMTIRPEGSDEGVTVPYAPVEVQFDGMADTYGQVPLMGQEPLIVKEGEGIKAMSFTLFLGTKNGVASQVPTIKKLEEMANNGVPVFVNYSSMEQGKWDITEMSVRTMLRRPSDHEVVQAEVSIAFYRSTGGATGLGPITGGVGKGGKGGGKDTQKITYTVKQGDTLHSIATKELKDASQWKDIAKWNDIKDPKKDSKLKAGGKLTLFVPVKKKGK